MMRREAAAGRGTIDVLCAHCRRVALICFTLAVLGFSSVIFGRTNLEFITAASEEKSHHRIGNAADYSASITATAYSMKLLPSQQHFFDKAQASVVDLLDDYKRQHGLHTLVQRNDKQQQQPRPLYAVAAYACPYQAGNQLHHFLNAFAFSVITNRTMLWRYCYGNLCRKHGKVTSCERVLHRHSWIPSLRQYYDSVSSFWSPWWWRKPKPSFVFESTFPKADEVLARREVPLDQLSSQKLVDFGLFDSQASGPALFATKSAEAVGVLSMEAQLVAEQLFAAGTAFAYGALFHAAFCLVPKWVPQQSPIAGELQQLMKETRKDGITIAIHSRHGDDNDDGSNTTREESCLEEAYRRITARREQQQQKANNVTEQHVPSSSNCIIALMSDRNATLSNLAKKARDLGCRPAIANHQRGQSFRKEHGEFSGEGFFQDLALAQYSKDAVIKTVFGGARSTSSDLMASLVAFRRTEVLQRSPLLICSMNYGWGGYSCTYDDPETT